jgi:hypothetical protein
VKCVVLIYGNPESRQAWEEMSDEQRAAGLAHYQRLNDDLDASGERIVSERLAFPELTKRVSVGADGPQTTDGPFAEAKEFLAGFYLLDCASFERAAEIAGRIPEAAFGVVEVRPVLGLSLAVSKPCSASSPRRSSRRWSGATAAPARARTPFRRRCWRHSAVPVSGLQDRPKGWLITTASRRRIEQWRSDTARQRREEAVALAEPPDPAPVAVDDALTLLLPCCHSALKRPSQMALTLRAVGGLTTAEIVRAFLAPEATIGQRISRAKRALRGERLTLPEAEHPARLAAVLQVLYLIFTEGHTASSGGDLNRVDLTTERSTWPASCRPAARSRACWR